MSKIINWCVKNRDAIFFPALSISIILVVTDDIIMKNPHTSLYYIVVIITLIGEFIYMCADSWDDNRWNECSHGIHFFIDRQSAVDY